MDKQQAWHLEADVPAARLATIIRSHIPSSVLAPGITDGRYCSVDAVSDGPAPAWMVRVRDDLAARGVYVDLREGRS